METKAEELRREQEHIQETQEDLDIKISHNSHEWAMRKRKREQDWNLFPDHESDTDQSAHSAHFHLEGNQKKHLLLKKRKEKYLQINQKLNKKKQIHLQQMDHQRLKFRSLILRQKNAQKKVANENDHHDLNPRG